TGRLKNLLAVSATLARTHAVLVLLRFKLRTSDQNKTGCRKNIETLCRVLTASLPLGLSRLVHWLRLIPAKLAPSHTGPNTTAAKTSRPLNRSQNGLWTKPISSHFSINGISLPENHGRKPLRRLSIAVHHALSSWAQLVSVRGRTRKCVLPLTHVLG